MPTIADVAHNLTAAAEQHQDTDASKADRERHLTTALQEHLHVPVMQLSAQGVRIDNDGLAAISDVVRRHFPSALDTHLPPRARVFTRLLRAGHLDAAWLVAQDNAVGVVQEDWKWSTSSGAARPQAPLPLLIVCEDGQAFAWLPGFRDPRFDIPDECFDIADSVRLQCRVDEAHVIGDELVLAGRAHLKDLATSPHEVVHVIATRTDRADQKHTFAGTRLQRPDQVKGTGIDLTRLAYAGWSATIDLRSLRARRATTTWRLALDLAHDGLSRSASLGPQRGQLVDAQLAAAPHRSGAWHSALTLNSAGQLHLRTGVTPDWRRHARTVATKLRHR